MNPGEGHEITFGEEEISDVTLATFYVFDKENIGPSEPSVQLVAATATAGHGCGEAAEATARAAEAATATATAAEAAEAAASFTLERLRRNWNWLRRLWRAAATLLVLAKRRTGLVLLTRPYGLLNSGNVLLIHCGP